MKKILLLIGSMFFIFGCNQSREKNSLIKKEIKDTLVATIPKDDFLITGTDSIEIKPFTLKIVMSDHDVLEFRRRNESMILEAGIGGIPMDTTNEEFKKYGSIFLTSAVVEIKEINVAVFKGMKFPTSASERLLNQDLVLTVYVRSGNRSSNYNLLAAEKFSKKLQSVYKEPGNMIFVKFNDDRHSN